MALTINLTLVVQVVHFLIAYLLITHFLLKPGYRALKVDHERMRQLKSALVHEQEVLAQKEFSKKEQWRVCQTYFATHRPELHIEGVGMTSTEAVAPIQEFTPEEVKNAAREISKKLEESLRND